MKLFKFALLIPLSKTNVEQGFSKMNLLISPFHSSLGNKNLNHTMAVFGRARKRLRWDSWEINKHIYCYRASYWFLVYYFLAYASVVMVISLHFFIIKRKSYFVFFIWTLFTTFGMFIFTCYLLILIVYSSYMIFLSSIYHGKWK